jgi:3-dehydroquinate synthase
MDPTSSFTFTQQQTTNVLVGAGVAVGLRDAVGALDPSGVVVVHDAALGELAAGLAADVGATATIPAPGAEDAKRLAVVGELADALHRVGATRSTAVIALGGGSVTDLVGFTASIYLRGVPLVLCPTTTLAMCDAALGGKNGVDHCGLKNRLGTIRQPDVIVMDTDWLASLPDALFCEGLVEVVKKAAVLDAGRFCELEELAASLRRREPAATARAVEMAIDMKMQVVLEDEREAGRRRALNAGHTIGHAVESLAGGALRHGHAVAMGLVAECRAADVAPEVTERVAALLGALGVETEIPAELRRAEPLWDLARRDKKATRGAVWMYVPRAPGAGELAELTPASLEKALS